MSPFEAIGAHYIRQGVSFAHALEACMRWGFVESKGDYHLMAIPTRRVWLDYGLHAACPIEEQADTWFIMGMAGDMEKAWSAEPYPLPWFAFERGKRLHIWRRERIRALTLRHGATLPA